MAATIEIERTATELQAWTVLDDNASGTPFLVTSQIDISSEVACLIMADMAACTTLAIATAGECIFYGKSGSTHDDWHEFARRSYGVVPNGSCDLSDGVNSGEISCGMTDTTGCETRGQRVLIYCSSTPANSMVNTLADWSDEETLYFCMSAIQDYTITQTEILCPTASTGHGVAQWNVRVPEEYWAARVSFHNDDADVNYLCRVQYSFITDYTSV
jgi:hypothetical protein